MHLARSSSDRSGRGVDLVYALQYEALQQYEHRRMDPPHLTGTCAGRS